MSLKMFQNKTNHIIILVMREALFTAGFSLFVFFFFFHVHR